MHCACTWEPSEMRNSKGWLEFGLIQHFNKRPINFQRSDKTKENDFVLLGWQIVGRQIYGEINGRHRLVLARFVTQSPLMVVTRLRTVWRFLWQERYMGSLIERGRRYLYKCVSYFKADGGQRLFLIFVSQLSSAQNNPMPEWHLWGWHFLLSITIQSIIF